MARGGEVMGSAKGGALHKAPSSKPSMSRTTTATPKGLKDSYLIYVQHICILKN